MAEAASGSGGENAAAGELGGFEPGAGTGVGGIGSDAGSAAGIAAGAAGQDAGTSSVGDVGGITGGLGISLGDLAAAAAAQGFGGPLGGVGDVSGVGGVSGQGAGFGSANAGIGMGYGGGFQAPAGVVSGDFAALGTTSPSPSPSPDSIESALAALGVSPAAGFGVATSPGSLSGVPAEVAGVQNPGLNADIANSDFAALAAQGLALGKGDALGPVGPNYAGNVSPDAGFGVATYAGGQPGTGAVASGTGNVGGIGTASPGVAGGVNPQGVQVADNAVPGVNSYAGGGRATIAEAAQTGALPFGDLTSPGFSFGITPGVTPGIAGTTNVTGTAFDSPAPSPLLQLLRQINIPIGAA